MGKDKGHKEGWGELKIKRRLGIRKEGMYLKIAKKGTDGGRFNIYKWEWKINLEGKHTKGAMKRKLVGKEEGGGEQEKGLREEQKKEQRKDQTPSYSAVIVFWP